MPKVNGEDIQLHYGDKLQTLPERLDHQDREIQLLKRMLVIGGALFIVHAFDLVPLHDLFPLLLGFFGI